MVCLVLFSFSTRERTPSQGPPNTPLLLCQGLGQGRQPPSTSALAQGKGMFLLPSTWHSSSLRLREGARLEQEGQEGESGCHFTP